MNESDVKNRIYDEILQFAESRQADGFKKKYHPEPEAPVEPELEAAPESDELDQESLSRLAAMAGE